MGSSCLDTVFLLYNFFFNYSATTEFYTLSLHDALPIRSEQSTTWRARARWMASSTRTIRPRSEEHTSELQSHSDIVCRLLLEKKKLNELNQRRRGIAK